MESPPPRHGWSRGNAVAACGLFVLALGFHFWGATRGWNNVNLVGCEFRQTQTAMTALFVQRENNFSLAYPTPVLGKPWSTPLEFPLYQWTVVKWSNVTGMPLTQSGRLVSLSCFYLGLPAIYLLLAGLGLSPSRRLLVLAFVLSCPLYIFYAQVFLIETMAWMFGVWFLVGYARALERRRGGWWLLAAVAGTGAALVKVTTFFFFLMPAAALTVFLFWRERPARNGGSWRAWFTLSRQGLASLLLPWVLALLWIRYTDAIKLQSIAGNFLTSARQRNYVFGHGLRFSGDLWRQHLAILFREIAPLPVLVATCLMLAWSRRWVVVSAVLVACFFVVQEIFPILYAWHEYYFVANACALMAVIGLAADGLLGSRLPRPAAWAVVLALLGAQAWTFGRVYYPIMRDPNPRGNGLTLALRQMTRPDDVLVVSGDDWSSIMPFYSERRTLMIRTEMEKNREFIEKAFAALQGEPVAALVLQGDQRNDQQLIAVATRHFQLDPRPVLESKDQRVYFSAARRDEAIAAFENLPYTRGMSLAPESRPDPARFNNREVAWQQLPGGLQQSFSGMTPRPGRIFSQFGFGVIDYEGRTMLSAHPDTRLWFKVPAGRRNVSVECAIAPGAYADSVPQGDRTDGVEFVLSTVAPDGTAQKLISLLLDPAKVPADRHVRVLEYAGELAVGSDILLETRPGPHGSYSRDWALLGRVEIR